MSDQIDRYLPVDVVAHLRGEMLERVKTAMVARAAEFAALARRDLAAFEKAWHEATEQAVADATEHFHEQV